MRWSLRATLLAITLPLALATVAMSAAFIVDLVTIRDDIAGLRASGLRSIYAERYARHLQVLLRESFDHVAGLGDRHEAVAAARAGLNETSERLRSLAPGPPSDPALISELTTATLREWADTQEQIDLYLGRAVALARKGEGERARRLVMDDLEVLVRSRIFSSIDPMIQREQELLEQYRVRIIRATEHWPTRLAGAVGLRERALPDLYEAILTERFARSAYADLKAFTYHVVDGRPLDAAHGAVASQTIHQLEQLRSAWTEGLGRESGRAITEPNRTFELAHEAYAYVLALPPVSRRVDGIHVLDRLDEVFRSSLLPHTRSVVSAREQSVEGEMRRLDRFAQVVLTFAIGLAALAIVLGLSSPYLASRLLVEPVRDLVDTMTSFRSGDADARPRVRSRNELGLLSRSLKALLDDLRDSDRKVRDLAFYDSITGLPNRQFFQERLAGALTTARIQERAMGLISLHLSGLKQVNDTLGHRAGDDLVRQVAARLCESVRLTDIVSRQHDADPVTEVSRTGGDDFTILLTKITKPSDSAIAAHRVLSNLAEPLVLDGRDYVVNASIGIGVYPQDGGDVDTLLRSATAAMNHAIERGGNDYQFYSEAMNVANSRKLHIQSRLSGAIERDDLDLEYQPVRESTHGHVVAAEALLRWTDAEMGPIGPDEFVPIAEQSGLVAQIGQWVLSTACAQARAWTEAGHRELRMSVNVSAFELRDQGWVETVERVIRETGISPGCLELEITETTALQDHPRIVEALTEVSELGVGIALDDFGTGFSSLSHLRNLPISRIKIDRSFVSEIDESGEGGAFAGAIVALARSLDVGVVAEGVETSAQADFLRRSGCDELQGYLISRAVPASEFEQFLSRRKKE